MNIIFWDTAPFIYLLEGHPIFSPKIATHLHQGIIEESKFMTSTISLAEYGVMPIRAQRQDLIVAFEDFNSDFDFEMIQIDGKIAKYSCQLRARYQSLKLADSLQLSSAILNNCNRFFTNDKALLKVSEVDVVLVDDLKGIS